MKNLKEELTQFQEMLRTNAKADWSENDPSKEFFALAKQLKKIIDSVTTDGAREFLETNGFQTENLWHVDDVKSRFICENDNDALYVLHKALTNDATMEQIWLAIDIHAENEGLAPKPEED